ncbi:LEM domain-containing protein 2 isoform X2 [Bufo gargarizans]|uniref:LEM domain-containing protein 2 isoform X2 n=1 Tax=Bufo gargarizans TaxID=30331 RepID=UPI001CF19E56|nr:LEM domain-containing protein 2 isoform X2 [Bufo gargarizans]
MSLARNMSDSKLRSELINFGYIPGPITDSTRGVLEKKLEKLRSAAKHPVGSSQRSENATKIRRREPQVDSSADDKTWKTLTSDRRRQSHEQSPKERVLEESSRRGDGDRRVDESSILPAHIEESALTNTSLAYNPGYNRYSTDIPERSSTGYNRYSTDIPERSSTGYNRDSTDIPERSSTGYNRYSTDIPERSSTGYNRYSTDIPERSSTGYNRDSTDIPERSSTGYNRYSTDILERSSTGYNRDSTDIPERSSTGYNRDSTDIPERSSTGYNRYSTDIPERSSTGYNRYPTDVPERSSINFNRFSGDELRYRPISDSIRDQRKSPYISSNRSSLDSLSPLTYAGLKQEKMSHLKPSWAKKLERYLSRLLRLLCVVLVLVFSGILIMKSGILSTSQDDGMKLVPSDCEGRQDPFCKAKQKEITLRILSELYDFLSLQAGSFECGNPSGLSSKCVPINTAKEHVLNVSGFAAEKFDAALEWMLSSKKHLGIWAKGEGTEERVTLRADVFCVESSRPRLGLICRLKNALYTAISNLFLALLGIFMLWIVLIFLRYHWQRLEEEEKQMFVMVEKIIDVVNHHYKDWTLGREQNPYIGILHVRDSLIKPQDRKHLKRAWDRAVQFVEAHESRVRTELQRVAGADLRVWRWTQTRNERLR